MARLREGGNKRNRKPSQAALNRLADNVKRLRNARGMTQKELGTACGLDRSYIGQVEQGAINPTFANLEAIAKGLNCTVGDLTMKWSVE
ncbi:MAG TPA: helix-turn-helix transcriptional regulator [Steroidobacteraceae bacterium]|nr:helix-turn-helix transcriptional regulator [Steroidobacteraceae bacterium]